MIGTWVFTLLSRSWIAKWASIALVGIAAYWTHTSFVKRSAIKSFVADSIEANKERNEEAETIRGKALRPGAHQRLLKSDCRDC